MTFILLAPIVLALALLTTASTAFAYIGPGAGMSVVGSLLTILATIFVASGAIIIWPVRKFMKRRKARRMSVLSEDTVKAETIESGSEKTDPEKTGQIKSGQIKTGTVKTGTVKSAVDHRSEGN